MSHVSNLTDFYGSFFLKTGKFAVSPYLLVAGAFIKDRAHPKTEELILGVGACIFLSVVVPVLPVMTDITFAIAGFAMSLAVASMFFSYPIALLLDAIEDHKAPQAPQAHTAFAG